MKRILIIEDEPSLSRIMDYDLSKAGFDVEVVADGIEGLEMARLKTYELMLIDWMLPGVEGIDIVKALRAKAIETVIVMISAKHDELDVIQGLEAGADDYLKKPFSSRELVARIEAHLRRVQTPIKSIVQIGHLLIDYRKREVQVHNKNIIVTKKEFDLLNYFVMNKNNVLSRDQILLSVWGYTYDGDTRIVDVHIFKLRDKLVESGTVIKTIRGIGYLFEEIKE